MAVEKSRAEDFARAYDTRSLTAEHIVFGLRLAREYIRERDTGLPQPALQQDGYTLGIPELTIEEYNRMTGGYAEPVEDAPTRSYKIPRDPGELMLLDMSIKTIFKRPNDVPSTELKSDGVLAIVRVASGEYGLLMEMIQSRPHVYGGYVLKTPKANEIVPVECLWDLTSLNAISVSRKGVEDLNADRASYNVQSARWL